MIHIYFLFDIASHRYMAGWKTLTEDMSLCVPYTTLTAAKKARAGMLTQIRNQTKLQNVPNHVQFYTEYLNGLDIVIMEHYLYPGQIVKE